MFKELAHHIGVHFSQHPQETLAATITAGKAVAPIVVAAAPYLAAAAAIAGAVYLISEE